jgi:arsenate reductase-like glutaredoxin family protein
MSFRLHVAQPILTLIYNPVCNKCNKTLSILHKALEQQPGIFNLDVLDYQKTPLTRDQLRSIVQYLSIENDLGKILRNEDGTVNEGDTATKIEQPKSIQELANIVKEQPIRLQRPILVDWDKGRAIIARPAEKVDGFLKELGYIKE